MLDEAASVIAAGILQAAGTDAWAVLRARLGRLLGRGDAQREQAELMRLDQTTSDLEDTELSDDERELLHQSWQVRLRRFLEGLDERERAQVITELRALMAPFGEPDPATGALVQGNTFEGPTAFQIGAHTQQTNHFGSGA
ncbi:hypothetical protein [Streptomyces sp. NPDC127190]|uniref:hypothetical protein n=1 Tax=unclassified Streptomyces TaxID=2593676 RepID=UPI0036278870